MHKVLVIGVGSIGERHVRCFLRTGRAELSICEIDDESRERIKAHYAIPRAYENLDDALSSRPDAVVIATPANLHIPMALQAADSDCHLFIEKPISTDARGIGDLEQRVHERGLIAQVGYAFRHYPFATAVKDELDQGRWGIPLHLTVVSGQHFPTYRPAYRDIYYAQHVSGGGAVQDGFTHFLDMAQWWVGPIDRIIGDVGHLCLEGVEVEDTVNVLARHGNVMGSYHFNQYQYPNESTLTMVCDKGTLCLELFANRLRTMDRPGGAWEDRCESGFERDDGFIDQANAFLNAVEGQPSISCSIGEASHTLRCHEALLDAEKRDSLWYHVDEPRGEYHERKNSRPVF